MMPPVALSLGDPAGIGGEIALKAWRHLADEQTFFVIGDFRYLASLGADAAIRVVSIADPAESVAAMRHGLPVLDLALPVPPIAGHPEPRNAASVIEAICHGVELVRRGAALALCTNPINKKALKDGAGFAFPGHTEFLAAISGAHQPVMMLAGPQLRVVPVTIHIPLAEVPRTLTADLLARTLRITRAALVTDFGISEPRIAVAGLNPHAGEGGVMGREEISFIAPVVEQLRAVGFDLVGPLPADTMFHAAMRSGYDVAVCMYHDQALIPIKTLDFDRGVNVTLGLDFVRTSPDHGTAYDIAGHGVAAPTSLIEALRLAQVLGTRRRVAK